MGINNMPFAVANVVQSLWFITGAKCSLPLKLSTFKHLVTISYMIGHILFII